MGKEGAGGERGACNSLAAGRFGPYIVCAQSGEVVEKMAVRQNILQNELKRVKCSGVN
jgi:hypothetical protein